MLNEYLTCYVKDVLGQLGEGGDEDKIDGDGPEIGRENEKIADLLGVDWSQLMEQQVFRFFCTIFILEKLPLVSFFL